MTNQRLSEQERAEIHSEVRRGIRRAIAIFVLPTYLALAAAGVLWALYRSGEERRDEYEACTSAVVGRTNFRDLADTIQDEFDEVFNLIPAANRGPLTDIAVAARAKIDSGYPPRGLAECGEAP